MRRRVVAALVANTSHALSPWAGTTRLRSLAQEVSSTTCEQVAVVVGASPGSVTNAIAGLPVATLPNVLWFEGVAAAIRCAVAWALRAGAEGLLLVQGDQTRVDRAHVESLLAEFRRARAPVASYVNGEVGLPAVFGVESFARLGQLVGDRDAREVLRTTPVVTVPWPEGAIERAIDVAIESALADMVARAGEPEPAPIAELPA